MIEIENARKLGHDISDIKETAWATTRKALVFFGCRATGREMKEVLTQTPQEIREELRKRYIAAVKEEGLKELWEEQERIDREKAIYYDAAHQRWLRREQKRKDIAEKLKTTVGIWGTESEYTLPDPPEETPEIRWVRRDVDGSPSFIALPFMSYLNGREATVAEIEYGGLYTDYSIAWKEGKEWRAIDYIDSAGTGILSELTRIGFGPDNPPTGALIRFAKVALAKGIPYETCHRWVCIAEWAGRELK